MTRKAPSIDSLTAYDYLVKPMGKKVTFTNEQIDVLLSVVQRAAKDKRKFKNQEALALALDLSQPSLSNLLRGKWNPGLTTAQHIANLNGQTLEDLIGPFEPPPTERPSTASLASPKSSMANLEACVRFFSGTRSWSAWTIAAARAGFFGESDFQPPAWAERLDELEAVLSKARAPKKR